MPPKKLSTPITKKKPSCDEILQKAYEKCLSTLETFTDDKCDILLECKKIYCNK